MSKLKIHWYSSKAKRAAHDAAKRGLLKGAEHVLDESNRVVPLDESDLLKSGQAFTIEGKEPAAGVSYGEGLAERYARRQHEELTWHHEKGRKAKYLEDVVNDSRVQSAINELVRRELDEGLR